LKVTEDIRLLRQLDLRSMTLEWPCVGNPVLSLLVADGRARIAETGTEKWGDGTDHAWARIAISHKGRADLEKFDAQMRLKDSMR
jgi:hypothetical protein